MLTRNTFTYIYVYMYTHTKRLKCNRLPLPLPFRVFASNNKYQDRYFLPRKFMKTLAREYFARIADTKDRFEIRRRAKRGKGEERDVRMWDDCGYKGYRSISMRRTKRKARKRRYVVVHGSRKVRRRCLTKGKKVCLGTRSTPPSFVSLHLRSVSSRVCD